MLGFGPLSSLPISDDGGGATPTSRASVNTTLDPAFFRHNLQHQDCTAALLVQAAATTLLAIATVSGTATNRLSAAASTTLGDVTGSEQAVAGARGSVNVALSPATVSSTAANRTSGAVNTVLEPAFFRHNLQHQDCTAALLVQAAATTLLAPVTGSEQAVAGARGSVNITLAPVAAVATGRLFRLPIECRIVSPIGTNRFLETKGCDVQTLAFPDRFTPEILDYAVNFRGVQPTLDPGENIVSADVTVTAGDIVVSEVDHDTGHVSFWLSGGTPVYQRLAVRVTTSSLPPRTYQAEATIACLP